MQRLLVLVEVAERRNRTGAVLDFVEKEECLARNYGFVCARFEFGYDSIHVKVIVKDSADGGVLLEVDLDKEFKVFRQMAYGGRLADLSGTSK